MTNWTKKENCSATNFEKLLRVCGSSFVISFGIVVGDTLPGSEAGGGAPAEPAPLRRYARMPAPQQYASPPPQPAVFGG